MARRPGYAGRAGLNRERVVAAAAALADADGIASVTLAGLADHLGVRTPSLYNHIAGLDDLRRALALAALHELTTRLTTADEAPLGTDRLLTFARVYREFAAQHPGLYAAVARGAGPADDPALVEASLPLVDLARRALPACVTEETTALHAVRALRSLLHGFVSLESIGGFGLPLDVDESFELMIQNFEAGLRASSPGPAGSMDPVPSEVPDRSE